MVERAGMKFPNGRTLVVRLLQQRASLQSRYRESALVVVDDDGQVEMDDCIDTSPSHDVAWTLVCSDSPKIVYCCSEAR